MTERIKDFLWLCKSNDVDEFYVNFDKPFDGDHDEIGDVCLVYCRNREHFLPFDTTQFLPAFSPSYGYGREGLQNGIWCYEIRDDGNLNLLSRRNTIKDSTFKCIYIKGVGLVKENL